MDKKKGMRPWLITLVALLDDIAILALIFIVLFFFDVDLPWPLLVIIVLLIAAVAYIVHRAVVRSLTKKLVTGAEGMIGAYGKAVEPLDPSGMVDINCEYWKAVSPHGKIEKGRRVEVVGINGLTLEVKEIDSD